jgi:hypothetical protein
MLRSRLSIKIQAKVKFSAGVLAKGSLSAYVMRTTRDSAGFDLDNLTSSGLKLGDVEWTGDLKQTWEGCTISISDSFEAGLAFTLGIGPDLKFFDLFSKFNDVATLTAPYLQLDAPIAFDIGGPPALPNGGTCNTCNQACPSTIASFKPTAKVGVKVRIRGPQ